MWSELLRQMRQEPRPFGARCRSGSVNVLARWPESATCGCQEEGHVCQVGRPTRTVVKPVALPRAPGGGRGRYSIPEKLGAGYNRPVRARCCTHSPPFVQCDHPRLLTDADAGGFVNHTAPQPRGARTGSNPAGQSCGTSTQACALCEQPRVTLSGSSHTPLPNGFFYSDGMGPW